MGYLIFGIIATAFLMLLYAVVTKVLNFLHRPKKITLDTPVEVFLESNGTDKTITKVSINTTDSISAMYEEMCVKDPVKYKDDIRVKDVLETYGKLIRGEQLDPEGKHIPSEYLEGQVNPDYKRYLQNQKNALKRAGKNNEWVRNLYKEFITLNKYRNSKEVFLAELNDAGIPYITALRLVTDERMANTSNEEWKVIKQQVERYLNDFEAPYVNEYITQATDVIMLCDYDKMETFATWVENEVPSELAYMNVCGAVSEEDMHEIIRLSGLGLDSKEATRRVLEKAVGKAEADNLRDTYRKTI